MYLSKIVLSPHSKEARRDLASPYQMHATLSRVFASKDEKLPRFLWRQEVSQSNTMPVILVQSGVEASWSRLVNADAFEGYFYKQPEQDKLPLRQLENNQILRFRLKANPTVTRQGKRIGLYKYEDLIGYKSEKGWHAGWLERQANKGGFELLNVTVKNTNRLKFYKHKGGQAITLQAALFEGNLRITDLELFIKTLGFGIGKAKALGFGLLSIAKS